jgi:hypothetical protein
MNYIPGFSKYLETSVPRYAIGGRVMDGERMMYDMGGYGDGDTRGYSEPYQYTPPVEQYMPVEQPMMYGGYDMGGYNEMPYGGGGMLPAPVEQPYQQAAVEPMTTEAVPAEAPFDPNTFDFSKLDLSGLNNLYGMNFGSNFGGGPMGGIYQADPNLQYIGAPLSNKGNATSQTGGNTFAVRADQPVRLVDHRTNQIVFEGTGFDAARKATELGQGLTDQFGRKANYSIQTADPTGNYSTVAYEKKNKSTLGKIAGAVGTALPIAVSLIPGLQFVGPVASAALAGGAGAALKGQNILKGVAMGGLSAAGGQVLGPALGAGGALGTNLAPKLATAIGTGLGSTAGGLATGQSLKSSLLGGVASGALSYVAPDIQRELGISPKSGSIFRGGDSAVGSGTGGDAAAVYGGPNAEIVVNAPAFSTPNVNLGGFKTPAQKYLDDAANTEVSNPLTNTDYASGYDGDIINVTGSVPGAVTGGVSVTGGGLSPEILRAINEPAQTAADDSEIIKVTGQRPGAVTSGVDMGGLSPEVFRAVNGPESAVTEPNQLAENDIIKVTGQRPGAVTGGFDLGGVTLDPVVNPVPELTPEEILVKAREKPTGGLTVAQNPVVNGVDQVTKEIVATGNKIEQPVTGGLTLTPELLTDVDKISEAERKAKEEEDSKKLGLEEYLRIAGLLSGLIGGGGGGSGQTGTYGGGGTGRLNPIFSAKLPSAGGLGTIGANRTARPMGDVDWLTYGTRPELNFFDYASQANPAPITTPIPNEPRGPSMYAPDVDNMRFAKGGSSKRSEFAVNGPGTGRSDDIPAVLSDGEYVIDAETVALLGDGSNKAGAKKLDELRVKVRKHKGQKLAKGRFSANAKKAEAYLSGGRI